MQYESGIFRHAAAVRDTARQRKLLIFYFSPHMPHRRFTSGFFYVNIRYKPTRDKRNTEYEMPDLRISRQ